MWRGRRSLSDGMETGRKSRRNGYRGRTSLERKTLWRWDILYYLGVRYAVDALSGVGILIQGLKRFRNSNTVHKL
jgi:hypothetical protein